MEVYIVRHGETVWNVEGKMQGRADIALNEKGRELAAKLGRRLRDVEFDVIYSSPLMRAYETACLIRGERDIPVVKDDRLIEISFGVLEGTRFEDWLKDDCPYRHFFQHPEQYTPPEGGETLAEVRRRTKDFLQQEIEPYENKRKRVMLVAHGALNKGLMCYIEGRGQKDYWGGGLQKNCEADIYVLNQGKWAPKRL